MGGWGDGVALVICLVLMVGMSVGGLSDLHGNGRCGKKLSVWGFVLCLGGLVALGGLLLVKWGGV